MTFAVIDTNVLVSALLEKSENAPSVQIAQRLFTGDIIPLYSQDIMNEYYEVLHRERFKFTDDAINLMLCAIEQNGISVEPSTTGKVLTDMKDLPFYEVAYDMQNDGAYLVTGNTKHFPKETYVVTPRQMLDILSKVI